jgi:hypothetical protein
MNGVCLSRCCRNVGRALTLCDEQLTPIGLLERPRQAGCVNSQRPRFPEPLLFGSGESCTKGCGSDQIDGADDVVGQRAECRLSADFLEAPGKESPAGGHSLDGSEGMFRGASTLFDQGRIGLETGVQRHGPSFYFATAKFIQSLARADEVIE